MKVANNGLNILLLGGTGAIGTHLANILLNKGYIVYITSRKDRKSKENLIYIQGNAHDNSFLSKVLSLNCYHVCVDFMSYKTNEFSIRLNMLLSSVKQYVYLSSSRVYSNVDEIITEKTPRLLDISDDKYFLSMEEYSLAKARQEDLLMNSCYSNWTIIRPYITYSENRLQLGIMEKEQWLYRAVNGRTIVFSNDISEHYTTLTYGKDVARGIASICGKSQALGEVYHITSSESIKWSDVLDIYMKVIKKYYILPQPYKLFPKSMYLRYPSMQYQVKYDRYFDRRFDNTKINKFIDTSQFVSIEKGLTICLEYFLRNPQFSHFDMRGEALRDSITEQCASRVEFSDVKSYYMYLILRYLCPKLIL